MRRKSKRDLEQSRQRVEILKENIPREVPLLKKQAASTLAKHNLGNHSKYMYAYAWISDSPPWRNSIVHASRFLSDPPVNGFANDDLDYGKTSPSYVAGSEFHKVTPSLFPFSSLSSSAFDPIFSDRSSPEVL